MTLTSLRCVCHIYVRRSRVKILSAISSQSPRTSRKRRQPNGRFRDSILDPSRPTLLSLFSVLDADQLLFLRRSSAFCFFPRGGCRIIQHVVFELFMFVYNFVFNTASIQLQFRCRKLAVERFFCNFRNFG